MKKIKLLLSLSHKFCLKYALEYFKMLLKPCMVGLIGVVFVPFCIASPIFALLPLIITLPCLFYAFWRGFCATYLLNYASLSFIKQETGLELKAYENAFKAQEKDFAKFVSFSALVVLICYLPCVFFVYKKIPLFISLMASNTDFITMMQEFNEIVLYSFIVELVLVPFTNYFTQSYFFKKKNENYFNLIFNCYKNLNKEGFLIALIITLITSIISSINIFLLPLLIVLNLYYYSINTFWYYSKNNA